MSDSRTWAAEQEAEEEQTRRAAMSKWQRDRIITKINLLYRNHPDTVVTRAKLNLIEQCVDLEPSHISRVAIYVRNHEAVAEIARVFRMFNQGSFE